MSNMIVELSKYFMIILIAFYTLHCFIVFRYSNEEDRSGFYIGQNIFMFLIHFLGFLVLCFQTGDKSLILFYGIQQVMMFAVIMLYRILYPHSNRLIVNNMCMLLSISFIILTRLSYDKSVKQFKIVLASLLLSFLLLYFVSRMEIVKKLTWLWGGIGIFSLAAVMVLGSVTNGSKISYRLFGFTFQPSEFVKIIFVFFVAGMFTESVSLIQVITATMIAGAHVVILVLSKDLGSALIFFVVYVVMLYVGTKKPIYLLAGFGAGFIAALVGYRLFPHVQTRVTAWRDPYSVIEGQGYQISQSLFSIGTGGWFGMGLYEGSPEKIPVVEADFIFSAISEEMGCLFGLCVILICISNFLMFMNIAMRIRDTYYRLVAVGLASIYGFQMFLTIGGVTKFIPLTGVTLPLVSYGGTSVLVTVIMFSIIQGIYIRREMIPVSKKDVSGDI